MSGASNDGDRATRFEPLGGGIPSAVICEWLRSTAALNEVVPILFNIEDIEDTPYGDMARPILDHLAYMIECRWWLIAQAIQGPDQ
jgi:hypothetical protein